MRENTQLVIADNDEWDLLIECNSRQTDAFLWYHLLYTNWFIFVHINVKYEYLAICCKRCQNGT